MKVYGIPKELPEPKVDYGNYDRDKAIEAENKHREALKGWLKRAGYTGKRTGEVAKFPVADGYAEYMLGEGKGKAVLLHLPYGDGYHYPDVKYLPKAEILRRIDADKRFAEMFKRKEVA